MKTGLALLLLGATDSRLQAKAFDLEASLARSITNVVYQPPSVAEFKQAKELFRDTLTGGRSAAELRTNWAKLGFAFYELTSKEGIWWLVSDVPGKEGGRGWYLFRTNQVSTLTLEAPHARNDVQTGLVGLRLFQAGQARAFAAGTITRHRADLARLDDSFFQAFTLAFADACPRGLVAQVHGFDAKQHSRVGEEIVASAGTRSPDPWVAELVSRLKRATGLRVLAYPHDTRQLGATLNVQGRALRQTAHCRFLHLEMTAELRRRLTRDDDLCRKFLDGLSHPQPQ